MDFVNNNLELLAGFWIIAGLITWLCLVLFKVVAPFGRHSSESWGPMLNNTLGWVLMEVPSPAFLWLGFYLFKTDSTPWQAYIPMALWSIHYFNRSFIFPFRLKNKKKKIPLLIVGSAIFFNFFNGVFNGAFLGSGTFVNSNYFIAIGLIVFMIGMYINMRSDNMLLKLRKPGDTGYKIPFGFLFNKVSSPNLFGEIVEWFGFFLICPSLGSLSFFVWTLSNLVPRARDHHNWYLKKFKDYPKDRKALLPNIW
jgi:3-oxo-5-alpha-steroid 4-dehydrogenase 1